MYMALSLLFPFPGALSGGGLVLSRPPFIRAGPLVFCFCAVCLCPLQRLDKRSSLCKQVCCSKRELLLDRL